MIPDVERALLSKHNIIFLGLRGQAKTASGKELVRVDRNYFRPTEVDALLGDPSKARTKLGWSHKTSFAELVAEMVDADLALIDQEAWRHDRTAR